MTPYILRTWEGSAAGRENGALSYFESDLDLTTVKECLATFQASFATRKEGTLFSVFPKAKLSTGLLDKLGQMIPRSATRSRRDFKEELLEAADSPDVPIANAVDNLHIVGYKAGYRQARPGGLTDGPV